MQRQKTLDVWEVEFSDSTSRGNAPIVFVDSVEAAKFIFTSFLRNDADGMEGGLVSITNLQTAEIGRSVFEGNSVAPASTGGGSVYVR